MRRPRRAKGEDGKSAGTKSESSQHENRKWKAESRNHKRKADTLTFLKAKMLEAEKSRFAQRSPSGGQVAADGVAPSFERVLTGGFNRFAGHGFILGAISNDVLDTARYRLWRGFIQQYAAAVAQQLRQNRHPGGHHRQTTGQP